MSRQPKTVPDNHSRTMSRWAMRRPHRPNIAICCLLVLLSNHAPNNFGAEAKIACLSTEYCETTLRPGSRCVDGFCDNPYQYGCLQSQNVGFEKHRICHSEDPPNAAELGLCRDPKAGGLNYPEIRIMGQNWESPFFEAWILQILLSEILDVPTTIETGVKGMNVNFYDPQARLDYGLSYDMEGLERASNIGGDCRNVEQIEGEPYKGCGHVILEIWSGQEDKIRELLSKEAVEPKSFIGVIGEEGWHIPKFTGERDPTLLGHFGLVGEQNRRKLAERFKFPTTWGDYCSEVASDGCRGNNSTVAARPPESEEESKSFFVEGLYTGHFRKTEMSDCDKWPTNCTGHFMDYPCSWDSFFIQQAYHLNIALRSNGDEPGSNGYTYEHLSEIWYAANWTKSDVIGWWWRPEALYQQFQGTDFELQSVSLPPTNYKCVQNRLSIEARCGADDALRVGNRVGACDVPPIPNYKLLSTGLFKLVYDPDTPEALRSPAYDVMKEFTIDSFILEQIFSFWLNSDGIDRFAGYNPRDAVCRWVSENLDDLQRFIPRSYPREVQQKEEPKGTGAAVGLGVVAVASTLLVFVLTYRQRNRRVFVFAQVEFVFLLLVGMLLVSIAAIIAAIPPTDYGCVAVAWLLNLGYTLELVPLVVKIAAINRLMQAALRMKRIKLSRRFLFGVVAALMAAVVVFMILWTVLDPPRRQGSYALTGKEANDGSTIVSVSYFCQSDSNVWTSVAVGTQALLLLCASILAFLTRKVRDDVNEANTISFLIYWNFVCVLLRVILLMLGGSIDSGVINRSLSMILSADSIATILIYFVPKFWANENTKNSVTGFSSVNVVSVGLPKIVRSEGENSNRQGKNNGIIYRSSMVSEDRTSCNLGSFNEGKPSRGVSFAGDVYFNKDTDSPSSVSGRGLSHRNINDGTGQHDNEDDSKHDDDEEESTSHHQLDRIDSDDSTIPGCEASNCSTSLQKTGTETTATTSSPAMRVQ